MSHPPSRTGSARAAAAFVAALPVPSWAAAESIPSWAAYALFVVAAVVVIALLLREALFTDATEEQPTGDEASLRSPQARYDATEAARKTAANRRVA